MRFKLSVLLVCLVACLSISMAAQEIRGDYLETRSADVYTGQCFATVQTRSIGGQDHLCGNEETFYPPLTELSHSMPAVALTDTYSGPGLGISWDLRGKRSAFVGTFAR